MGTADAPAFHLASPVATLVLDTRPTLRWTAAPGSPTYIVTLQDQSTGGTINSPPLQRTEWAPEQALTRGRTVRLAGRGVHRRKGHRRARGLPIRRPVS